jgi:hypothetical protein
MNKHHFVAHIQFITYSDSLDSTSTFLVSCCLNVQFNFRYSFIFKPSIFIFEILSEFIKISHFINLIIFVKLSSTSISDPLKSNSFKLSCCKNIKLANINYFSFFFYFNFNRSVIYYSVRT